MAIQYRHLSESYLADAQLPSLLRKLEEQIQRPYADSQGLATIGIGFNIRQNRPYLALVLQKLGVFTASDAMEVQHRQINNLGVETEAQRNARYTTIVDGFANIINTTTIVADFTLGPGNSTSEQALGRTKGVRLGILHNIAGQARWRNFPSFSNVVPGLLSHDSV